MPIGHPVFRPFRVFGLLWVTKQCEERIADLLVNECNIPSEAVQRRLHLTVYEARRPIQGLVSTSRPIQVAADTVETRFMVLAPGGENPRPELEPARRSVGIRLTRRNRAIGAVLDMRRDLYRRETAKATKNRKATTDWTNAFGARHYQPHIKILRPGSGIDRDLTKIGELFRSEVAWVEFGKFEIRAGSSPRHSNLGRAGRARTFR